MRTVRGLCRVSGLALLAGLASQQVGAQTAATTAASTTTTTTTVSNEAVLEDIVVTADRRNSFGANYVQVGSFRGARQLDTPLSITVIPREVLDAQQATSLFDALRNSAGVTTFQINPAVISNLAIRGIGLDARTNYRMDGALPTINLIDLPLEDKERVEVLKGVAALYYGFTNPSGIVNLTMKRPTQDPLNAVTVFGNSHGQIGAHADLSRRFFDGKFGVRVNAVESNVRLGIDQLDGRRQLYAATVDFDPIDQLKIRLNAEYVHKKVSEPTTFQITVPTNTALPVILPRVPNARTNYGAKWMYNDTEELNLLAHVEYKFLSNWVATVEGGQSELDRDRRFPSFRNINLVTGAGQNVVTFTNDGNYKNINARGEIAGAFNTWILKHQLSFGASKNVRTTNVPVTTTVSFNQNYYNPISNLPESPMPARNVINPTRIDDLGYYVFDKVSYGDWVELMGGVRRSDYKSRTSTTYYAAKKTSPTVGVVVKPMQWLSFYGTYIEGLEEGGLAPTTARNGGQVLPPALSTQYEAGVKAQVTDKLLITLAYFDIDRVSSFLNNLNFFVQDGRTRYKGWETSFTGEITPEVSVFASGMYLDAQQSAVSDPNLIGKRPENTPKYTGSLFLEVKPPIVPGLSLTGGVFYVGNRPINNANQAKIPGVTTFDLGARYTVDIRDVATTFKFNIENVTDKRYWASTGGALLNVNVPLTAKFSVSTKF